MLGRDQFLKSKKLMDKSTLFQQLILKFEFMNLNTKSMV